MTGTAPARVLVVDDLEDNRELLRAYLEAAGYNTLVADCGEQAVRLALDQRPDLVLLDVILPDRDGYDVCRTLKLDPRTQMIPVIMVSALEDSGSRVRGFEADADEFLSKPVNREELLARVAAALRLRKTIEEKETLHKTLEAERLDRVRGLFSRYISPQAVEHVLTLSEQQRAELLTSTERVDCAIMFTDVRGFTAMSEALQPEEVVAILNAHFNTITVIAHQHSATVFNLTGDGLLAGFGAPIPHPDPMVAAVEAALEMQRSFRATADTVFARHNLRIGLGIGINFGPVILGNVGSNNFMSFTVIGDTVNVAARLQSLAAGGTTVVAESVWAAVQHKIAGLHQEVLTDVSLKGKSQHQRLYRLTQP